MELNHAALILNYPKFNSPIVVNQQPLQRAPATACRYPLALPARHRWRVVSVTGSLTASGACLRCYRRQPSRAPQSTFHCQPKSCSVAGVVITSPFCCAFTSKLAWPISRLCTLPRRTRSPSRLLLAGAPQQLPGSAAEATIATAADHFCPPTVRLRYRSSSMFQLSKP